MTVRFTATGDSFTTRRIPAGYPGRKELVEFIGRHDVRFNNLETTYHRQEGYPAAFSGGTWAMADPVILDDILDLGFNIFNTANNHSLDYSHGGLLATIENLVERNMIFAGTGEHLHDASKAAYLDTDECRIGLIAATSDFHDSDIAGEQGGAMCGRPGVNGIRVDTVYHVTEEYYSMLQNLVKETNMNALEDYFAAIGYSTPVPDGFVNLDKMLFQKDEKTWVETKPKEADMRRVIAEVEEAKRQSDYVMVSIHTHAGNTRNMAEPPAFLETFARRCIDAGADVILGHGPHELRGIEIYNGKPIFYSLGNFIFETETVAEQPAEAFLNKSLPADTKVGAYMDSRSKNGTRGYGTLPPIWFSVIPSWELTEDGVRQITLHPISLGMKKSRGQKGLPALVKDDSILTHLQTLCDKYGTAIDIKDGVGIIRL